MEELGSEVATLLLVATPLLVVAKTVHGIAARRVSLAPRGSRGAAAEGVAWLLIAAVDAHIATLWLSSAHQAEDVCAPYRPEPGTDVHLDGGYFFEYPVRVRCVWPDGTSVDIVPWPLNAATAVFFTAALAVSVYAAVRGARRRRARNATVAD